MKQREVKELNFDQLANFYLLFFLWVRLRLTQRWLEYDFFFFWGGGGDISNEKIKVLECSKMARNEFILLGLRRVFSIGSGNYLLLIPTADAEDLSSARSLA